MLYKFVDNNYQKILKDRLSIFIFAVIIALAVISFIIITIILSFLHILFRPLIILDIFPYSLAIGGLLWGLNFALKWIKNLKLYCVAKEIHIYDDRFEFITPAGLRMVAKFEWIGLIDAVEEDPYALIFYYDENLRRCNYLYLSNDLVPHIVAQYKKWVERTGRKPCYIVIGKVSKKEAQKSMVILRRLEKSRFCQGARYLWR